MQKWYLYSFSVLSVFLCLAFTSKAQIISQFNWNSNPITTAVVGPNATSAGVTATSSPGGVGGTNGLNPGAPSPASNINLHIPNTGNVFDVSSIDISIDYRRNETTAQMVKRNTFTFNTGGTVTNFRVTYRVVSGTVVTTVTSTNVAIPSDAVFRNYRFTYENCSGIGTAYVNNVVVWTNTAAPTPGQNLYWVGEGDIVIGQDMDGANNNVPNIDNFILQNYTCTVLPIELVRFNGINQGKTNLFEWITATEKNNDYFNLERSSDGENWTVISKIIGAGNSTTSKCYYTKDLNPPNTINYYRLVQADYDGFTKKYSIVVIDNSETNAMKVIRVTNLLGQDVEIDYQGPRVIFYSNGTVIKSCVPLRLND